MDNREHFKDCRFGEIDFGFSPVFRGFIVHNHNTASDRKTFCVKSLKSLSLQKISLYSQLTAAAVLSVPVSLLSDLLELCVLTSRHNQLALLTRSWPLPVLKLLSNHRGEAYDYLEEININVDQRKQMLKMKSELVITVLQCGGWSSLNTLDITHFPMTLHFLSRASSTLGSHSALRVISDLVLDEDNMVQDLPDLNFILQIRHLHIACYDSRGVSSKKLCNLILQLRSCPQTDLSCVQGLQISRLDLRAAFHQHQHSLQASALFDLINEELPHISSLDLSYNAVNLNGDDRATSVLEIFLSRLSQLRRLHLGGNRLTNKIAQILRAGQEIQYLNLTGTQLRLYDVSYLATFTSLNHLDLSSNKLRNKLNVLRGMLEQLQNLEILEMIDCELDDECLDDLIPAFKSMAKLKIVNLTNNLILRQDFNINPSMSILT